MVQTHLFQVLTFVAMEPPISFDPDRLRDEKVKVLRAMNSVDPAKVVRGQFVGYRNEPDVASASQADTYAALEVEIENWRWAGVPFFLRTGKAMRRKVTEITLSFKDVPFNVFKGTDATPAGRDHLSIRVQPNEGISMDFNVKRPGPGLDFDRGRMDFDYQTTFRTKLVDSYELLILEAMEGDHTLFTREDEVERAWEVLTPVLEAPPSVDFYEPGSWGPKAADALIAPRLWHITALPDE
jgi:glucose-6-phosphate 1-dehydrogenase